MKSEKGGKGKSARRPGTRRARSSEPASIRGISPGSTGSFIQPKEEALADEAIRRRILIDQSRDGIVVLDANGKVYEANKRFAEMLGYSPKEASELHVWDWEFQFPREQVQEMIRSVDEKGDHFETRHRRKDGTIYDVEISTNGAMFAGQKLVFCVCRDITERKQAEEKVQHLVLVLRAIRNVNQLIARGADRDSLLKGVCENFVSTRGYYNAWIALLDESGKLVTAAEAGLGKEFRQMIERLKRGELPYCGRKVLKKTGVVLIEDPSSACADCPLAKDYSGRCEMSIRLEYAGKVYGLMTVSTPPGIASQKEELDLFEEVAGDIAFALYSMEQEQERKKAEADYQTVIRTAMDGFAIDDMQGHFLDVNEAYCHLMGYSRDELLNMSVLDLEVMERPEEITEHGRKIKEIGYDRFESRHRRKDGEIVDVEISANYLPTDGGRMFLFFRDITERKRAEVELELRSQLLDSATDSIFVHDFEGNFVYVNETACRAHGYSREEFMKLKLQDIVAQERGRPFESEFQKILEKGQVIIEALHRRKDGSVMPVEAHGRTFEAGGRKLLLVLIRDVTERKRVEEERGQFEQKAQIASRLASVGEMAAGIAHEINNPLTSVIGYSQLLSGREDIPEDVKTDLKAIDEGAQRVAGIIKRLLTFARQSRPERTLVSINDLITNTLDLRAYHLRTNNIKVTTKLATDLPLTTADPAQLQQVFLNIIVNAEAEMRQARGRGKLLVKTEEVNSIIRISFKDNGLGIAKKNLSRIFDPFFTTRDVDQGTGLGLSICHGIIAEHKGRIWAESKLGRGATFIVELPIVMGSRQLEMAEPPGKKLKKVPKAKILVVDDEPSTLDFLSRLLTDEGHEVETVNNADEALEIVKNRRYSLILLDIKMPGTSGIELYGRMQKIALSLAERVIFITGDVMGTDTEAFLSKTKAPYITKPFDVHQLKKKIERFLIGD